MESFNFHDGNVYDLLQTRYVAVRRDVNHSLQMHSSLVRRLSQEKELEGHQSCVNAIAWNSSGSLLISGSDDTRINIWSYSARKLLHSIETGHRANIFCTKFVPETSDELVVSGAGDAEVRLFNLSRLSGRGLDDNAITPAALYQCHTRRVKKLAVEVGNPNVVWSASEDGTLRQHDFREGASCPPAGSSHQECRNILLDLRFGAKRSLSEPPRQILALKSCDISTARPHLLVVGGSDAFARLYDRRMLPPLSSSQKRMPPPSCLSYFCPMHLSDHGRSSLPLTHVTFSPDGEEVLLSYSGEHVYLFNVNHGSASAIQYSPGYASQFFSYTPVINGVELQQPASDLVQNRLSRKRSAASNLDKCRKLFEIAERSLQEEQSYFHGIEACNEVLDGYGCDNEPALKHEILCTRSALFLKRNWKNDVYMAICDCHNARRINSSSFRAHFFMSEALSQLGKHKEALDFAYAAQCLAPSNREVKKIVESIKRDIAAAEAEKYKANDGAQVSEPRGVKLLSLSDILHRTEANSHASNDGPSYEREDSDEELDFGFEASISGDEDHDGEPNVPHGSINLRIHRKSDSASENGGANDSCGSTSSPSQERTKYQPEPAIDMKQRFVGHCNVGTDIKQASFLGQRGEFVASGSDDGRWFIWEKHSGRLIKMLNGDEAVVNCVQSHPFDSVVATSGIDNTIKIWTPSASVPSIVAGRAVGPETADFLSAMECNQHRLKRNREAFTPFEFLEGLQMREFTEGTLHPFECTQS